MVANQVGSDRGTPPNLRNRKERAIHAMAVGVTDHVCETEEIIELMVM